MTSPRNLRRLSSRSQHGRVTLGNIAFAGAALAADAGLSFLAPEKQMDGTIQELDFGANTMVFEGVRIRMAADVQVEIRGRLLQARVVKPPFVRNGKAQIDL